jgi:hypothetical protein
VSLQSRDIQQLLGKLSEFVIDATPQQKAFCIHNAFCCGVAILQHGLPWRRRPETLSRINYKQTLRVFLTIIVYRVVVGSLVTSLQTCESVTFFLNFSVHFDGISQIMNFQGRDLWSEEVRETPAQWNYRKYFRI